MLISALNGCLACAECTIDMEIILGTPDGTPSLLGGVCQVEGHFRLFGDSVNLGAR
jgi:hypothetical protein